MENQGAYPESPMEQDESYPCKGCGEVGTMWSRRTRTWLTVLVDSWRRESVWAWYVWYLRSLSPFSYNANLWQLETDGTSTVSDAVHAALCSTQTRTSSFWVMDHLYAVTAHTVVAPATTRSRTWLFWRETRLSALNASDAETANERSRTCAMRALRRVFSAWNVTNR